MFFRLFRCWFLLMLHFAVSWSGLVVKGPILSINHTWLVTNKDSLSGVVLSTLGW